MARSSEYLLPGYTYHLTQRCHDRQFLLRFARDRDAYREWLREGVRRHNVPVYGFCVTRNHVHIVVHVDETEAVSAMMQLASGSTAKQYNLRKEREGSMWEHPYQCTLIQDGRHLRNCLCYVDLNMVRAGAVAHPKDWRWCGYDELIGRRKRYRLIRIERLLTSLDMRSESEFRSWYIEAVEQRLAGGRLDREPYWTESLAVGARDFVEGIQQQYANRSHFAVAEALPGHPDAWTVREAQTSYGAI